MQKSTASFNLRLPGFVSRVLDRLLEAGYEAYIVGGALRNTYLKRPIQDWDIATSAASDQILELFTDTKAFRLRHETVTLNLSGRNLEITPFRGPEKTIEADLSGRDFTVDAMAYNPVLRRLIDPWDGQGDLVRKIIRATRDPLSRFQEDPIRLLRGVRLATELRFAIQEDTLETMKDIASSIRQAAYERIREELVKILMSSRPSIGFRLMATCDLLGYVLPELLEGAGLEQNLHHRFTVLDHILNTVDQIPPVFHLRLAALLHDIAKPRVMTCERGKRQFLGHEEASAVLGREIMERMRFPRNLIEKVTRLIRFHMIEYGSEWKDGAVRRLILRAGAENMADLLLLRKADLLAHGRGHRQVESINQLEIRIASLVQKGMATSVTGLAIDGRAVMKVLGLDPGPSVGSALRQLMEIVTDKPCLNNKEDLLELLKEMKNKRRPKTTISA